MGNGILPTHYRNVFFFLLPPTYRTKKHPKSEGITKATSNIIDFPTFAHKSRIMYYTEQLKSEDFKGVNMIIFVSNMYIYALAFTGLQFIYY